MSDTTEERQEASQVNPSEASISQLCEALEGASRRARQDAAHELCQRAKADTVGIAKEAETVVPALIDALFRPEAQTRWESLYALSELAPSCSDTVAKAYEGAEASLFDEDSAKVRIAAFCLLARLASLSSKLSDKVWPLLDEAIQCFHGDAGYRDMLVSLLELAQGSASKATKEALAKRVAFDAENSSGYIKTHSADIIAAAKGK